MSHRSLLLATVMTLFAATGVFAQTLPSAPAKPLACPEGTFHGKCVNPYVAHFGRASAIAFTQAQISITERPYAASSDTTFSYPNNVAAFPQVATRHVLIGGFGTRGIFESARRGE